MKTSHVCLVILANFCLSTLALPARGKEESDQLDPDLRDTPQSRRGVTFGTALGHKQTSDYNNEREKAFKDIFGGKREYYDYMNDWMNSLNEEEKRSMLASPQGKRTPFTFGTALGHKKGKNNGEYVSSVNAKFNELFGDSDD